MKEDKRDMRYAQELLLVLILGSWIAVEALGPILFNLNDTLTVVDIIKILCRASFYSSLGFLLLSLFGRKMYLIAVVSLTIYGALAYANLLYFRSFNQYFPLNMLTEFQQLEGLGASVISLTQWMDILFIIVAIVPIITYIYLSSRISNFSTRRSTMILSGICLITAIPSIGIDKLAHIGEFHKSVNWLIGCEPTRAYKVYGLMPTIAYQLEHNSYKAIALNQEDEIEISQMIKDRAILNQTLIANIDKPKENIAILLMESFNSSCITANYMPTLDSLCRQASTLYCPQIKQMTQGAMSIGGQLIVMSGLNGLENSVFAVDYPHNTYPSIAAELHKRNSDLHSYTVVGTSRNYWRQDIVNRALGVKNLFDKQDIYDLTSNPQNNVLDWAGDKEIFNLSVQKIPTNTTTKFCAVIISTDMHSPYTYDTSIKCDATFPEIQDASLHEYMRRAKYVDEQIATFIQALKDKGVYDDTLIVITSDHQVPDAYCSDAMRQSLSPYIPAIFINTGTDWTEQNKRNKEVVFCHSQVYPTMLQLMGLRPDGYAGLFPPMTDIEATQEFDFDNCDYATTTDERLKRIYDLEEKIIRSSYFGVMK